MKKTEFYIYKEDLIEFHPKKEMTISQFVEILNEKYCINNMKKMRTKKITDYLLKKGYLCLNDNGKKTPTIKGKLLGIRIAKIQSKSGEIVQVNLYNVRAQKYILDNFYVIIRIIC